MPRKPGESTLIRVDNAIASRLASLRDGFEAIAEGGRGVRPWLDSPVSMADVIKELLWQRDCHHARSVKASAKRKDRTNIASAKKGG